MGVTIVVWLEAFSTAEDQRFSVFMPRSAVKDALAKLEAAGCPKDASQRAQNGQCNVLVRPLLRWLEGGGQTCGL